MHAILHQHSFFSGVKAKFHLKTSGASTFLGGFLQAGSSPIAINSSLHLHFQQEITVAALQGVSLPCLCSRLYFRSDHPEGMEENPPSVSVLWNSWHLSLNGLLIRKRTSFLVPASDENRGERQGKSDNRASSDCRIDQDHIYPIHRSRCTPPRKVHHTRRQTARFIIGL